MTELRVERDEADNGVVTIYIYVNDELVLNLFEDDADKLLLELWKTVYPHG